MANPEHLAKLKEGVEAWNQWRRHNRDVPIDLRDAGLGMEVWAGVYAFADLREANLNNADLSGAKLSESKLKNAQLRKANLEHTDLSYADLTNAEMRSAKMRFACLTGAKLVGANLFEADLQEADLWQANLREALLSRSILRAAGLGQADLNGAVLHDADLRGANLCGADLRGADLSGADLSGAILQSADLTGASLTRALLIQTNLDKAKLSGCLVYGISAWEVGLDGAEQSGLVITRKGQPPIQVDDLEVAQFVYLLLNRQKLRNVITTIGEKAVLILGRFTERKDLLDRMADKLRSMGYLPMIFDFDRPTDRDLTETVKILAGLSRFAIADITNPRSVPLELQATVPDYMVPFVTILQRGQPAFGMFDDLPRKYHWALPLLEYNSSDTLLATFEQKVVNPALEKAQEVRIQKAAAPVRRSAED